ncbi:hypothetical protein GH807_12730 [Acetobacterium tundrae]|uniref:PucR C-terminal helix-turn-helix domain-containing protein n=2 Tax=Acetobacterium tundrae TaxID=132932 RepID=A0ABR6WN76_9FIRM|nr:hypothetical protein [Acetobacterium tundrae]
MMDIKLNEIAKLLDDYRPETTLSEKKYEWISDVVLVDGCIKAMNPNLLYLCEARHFQKIRNLNVPGNVLIVDPDDVSIKKMMKTKVNYILLNRAEKIETIYELVHQAFLMKRDFYNKKTKLVAALLDCKGLQHIIDTAYEVLENPMFISDLTYNILAFNENVNVGDPSWPTKQEEDFESYERLKKLNDSGVFERLYKSEAPCIENFDYSPTRWMAHKITINDKNIGHIAVVESERSFEDTDLEVLQFLCRIVASELQKDRIHYNQFNSEFEHFIIDLLEEKITQYESIEKRAKSLKLNVKRHLLLLTISPCDKNRKGMPLSYIKGFIDRLLNTEKSILYKDKITIIFVSDKKEFLLGETRKKLSEFLKNNQMNAGVSQYFHDIVHLKKFYLQSLKVTELGVQLKPEAHIFYYDDYSIYHLMEMASSQFDLKSFCNPFLLDLIEYDCQYKTDYCHNLYIYLLSDCSMTKASEIFQIHRNSMKYRIKKIEEVLGISLDDVEVKFSLLMTFKILTYVGEKKTSGF